MEQSADERAAASATESSDETTTKLQTLQNIYSEDLVTFRRDSSKRRSFNRETYNRLQSSIRVNTSQNSVSALKNRFENKSNESDKVKSEIFKTAINVNLTINQDKVDKNQIKVVNKENNLEEKQKQIANETIDKIDQKKVKAVEKEVTADEKEATVEDEKQIIADETEINVEEKPIKADEKKVKPPVPTKPVELQGKLKPPTLRRHKPDDSPKSTLQKRVSFSNDISRIPIPAPRKSLQAKSEPELRPQVITVELLNIEKEQATSIILPKRKKSDENSNYLEKSHRRKQKPQNFDFNKIEFAEPEDIHIIARGSSEDSIDKIEFDLNMFEMEGKKKKRSNSFKKILTGGFFNKKKEDDKKKTKKTENAIFADNVQNESSNHGQYSKMHAHNMAQQHRCQTQQRLQQPPDLETRYAQMHINRFNHVKQTFNQSPESVITEDYVCMDSRVQNQNKYMQHKYETNTSSSSNTLDSENLAFDSQRTRDSDHSSSSNQEKPLNTNTILRNKFFERNYESQETPPRAFDTYQNVQLVTPKALIPINSERPLPNPYQDKPTLKTIDRNLNSPNTKETPIKPNMYKNEFNDGVYGTVYDRKLISNPSPVRSHSSESSIHSINQNPSRSPSLEGSKLKLPANREKIELQPRIKSPIPPNAVSTDKIIATELLKSKKDDKNWPPSHQRLEIDIDYPDSSIPSPRYDQNMETNLKSKPPISPQNKIIQNLEAAEWHKKQREISRSPSLYMPNAQGTTNVMVHVDSHSPQNRCVTPNAELRSRSNTPNTLRSPSAQRSPPKHEIRQTVEAFCWKELKKMKEQEDRQIQMQIQLTPFGCAEDPVISHRSRSMSPNFVRNTRRSSSLPREVLRQRRLEEEVVRRFPQRPNEQIYGQNKVQNQNFVRNSPQRSTVGSTNVGRNGYDDPSYRPIFKRGSLTQQFNSMEPQYNKKVSFHNTQNPAWPTKNGFTQSPPQRRIEMKREISADDEVFLPNDPNGNEAIYGGRPSNEPIYGGKPVNEPIYGGKPVKEPIYGGKPVNEPIYGSRPGGEAIYGGKPINEPLYGTKSNQRLTREEIFYINQQRQKQIKEASEVDRQRGNFDFRPLPNEPIYGGKQNGDYMYANKIREPIYGSKMPNINENEAIYNTRYNEPVYITRQSTPIYEQQPIYGQRNQPVQERGQSFQEPLYDRNKRTTVNNKVCDMYGRIHDGSNPHLTSPPPQQKSGVLYGQLQRNSNAAPVQYQSYNQIQNPNFVRGTRLTASVNDMYRRCPPDPRYHQEFEPPNRPLPPLPPDGRMRAFMRRQGSNASDSESNASEIQRFFPRDQHPMKNRIVEEEWNSDGKSGRGLSGNDSGNVRSETDGDLRSRSRNNRRDDPRRHTLAGEQYGVMSGQGGPLSRTMDLEGQPRGYPPPSNAMLFDDDPGIMSEVETSSTGFRRGGKQRSSLPVVRTPSKTLERPLGLVFLQYRNETKRALLPNEITSIDTVKALFVRSFPKQLTMEYLDSPQVKIYIHDSSKDMFYELEDLRSHLREIRDRSVLRLFESADVSGGLPMAGIGIAGGVGHFEDPSYFSEPEFDSEYQHQHIHKSKGSATKGAPYYIGSTASLPRAGLLRAYSPAVGSLPPDRMKTLPTDGYMSSPERGSRYEDPYYSQYGTRSGSITPVIDEEVSDTELLDEQYSLYGVKMPAAGPRPAPRTQFSTPAAPPYDATRIRVEHMERQLANLTGLVQKALTQTPATLQVPSARDSYRDKSVSFEKSVSFSDEPPDMNSPKQHSPQHSERDRLKPAPPPKPASLSPGQYDGRHIYRDLQLTPEMYNQLRGLQKKAKDLRAEVRNLRRMSQAQAHSVRETIRDTFIKIRAMLLAGGEQVWQAGMDQERVRLSREEDLYKQEMIRLETDLSDLESTVEELRGNVINRKTRVNMSDVENMALILSKSSKTVADLKLRFPVLQDSMKSMLSTEMEKVVREEKFLKEEPERLESALRRCKKLTGTLVTLKRLASVQEQRLPCSATSADGRLSPSEQPPITPTSAQNSKPSTGSRVGQIGIGGDPTNSADGHQRPENALDALLDELQTFSKPHTVNTQIPQVSYTESEPPTLPVKGIAPSQSGHFNHPPTMQEIGRKGSMDSATILPTQNLTVSTATGSLRRLHSYPSGSDTDNSPPIQPIQRIQVDSNKSSGKPPIPERNADLLQHISTKRVPPPPPPRTSSKSPLASPTSPSLPPRSPATNLQHIQNVQNMVENKPMSQFETATQNLGFGTLRRNIQNRSSLKDRAQTLPRNIGSNLQVAHVEGENAISASNSSSCESVNSQDGTKKRKEELEQRHQELLKKQKALQEQYARLQQLQRGTNTLAVIPPAPDQLLKKTGSESNILQKMGLQLTTSQITGSLTNLPNTTMKTTTSNASTQPNSTSTGEDTSTSSNSSSTTNKVYETDIL